MPGSASSQQNTRSTAKARPSANVRAANLLANTPVLFRLPAITDLPVSRTSAPAEVNGAATAPTSMPVVAVVQQPSAVPAMPSNPVVEKQSAAQVLKSDESTWWEHWSSGVVLILLLIALATASILAIQRTNESRDPKWIAGTDSKAAADSLSGIDIGAIEPAELPVMHQDLGSEQGLQVGEPTTSSQASSQPDVGVGESSPLNNEPLSLSFGSSPQERPASKANAIKTLDPQATVSLQPPVGKASNTASLFTNNPMETSKGNSIPAMQTSSEQSKPTSDPSSKLWNSSSSNLSQPSLQFSSDPESLSNVDFNNAQPKVDASLTTVRKDGSEANASATQLVSTDSSSSLQPVSPTGSQGLMTTATPEFPREALLRTYQQYSAAKAEAGGNRYQQPASAATSQGYNSGVIPPNPLNNASPTSSANANTMGSTPYPNAATRPNGFDASATTVAPSGFNNLTYTLQPPTSTTSSLNTASRNNGVTGSTPAPSSLNAAPNSAPSVNMPTAPSYPTLR